MLKKCWIEDNDKWQVKFYIYLYILVLFNLRNVIKMIKCLNVVLRAPASNFCLNHISLWENLWRYFRPNLILFEPVSGVIFRTHLTSIFIAKTLKNAFISMVTLKARILLSKYHKWHTYISIPASCSFPRSQVGMRPPSRWCVLKSSQGTDLCFSCKSVQRRSNHLISLLLQLSRL